MIPITDQGNFSPQVLTTYLSGYNQLTKSLAVSPSMKYIAISQHVGNVKSFTGMYDSAYVRVYNLDSAHRTVSLRERIIVPTSQVRIENITFNSVDSIYFVYSLSDKSKRMAYKMSTGLNDTTVVNSNILRNTDDRLYVGTASVLRAYNSDGTYTTMANMANYHPIFIPTPIVINPGVLLARVTINQQQTGKKVYELKDHLGNVRATITDRKFLTGIDIPAYQAEPVTATDYYAFGSPLYGRNYTSAAGSYRFGFNGKEKDDEVMGEGNWQDYGARFYDTRLCRFPSPDPIIINEHKYPELSPYQFASLNPIQNIDLDGLEGVQSINQFNNLQASGKSFLKVVNAIPEPVKRGAYGTFQVVSGFGTCVGGVAIGVGTLGCATPLGIGVFVVGSSSVVAGVRTLANLADGGSKEDDPKYGNIAGEITQSETVDNLVGLGTSFAPTPNTFFNVVNWANRADNAKNLVQIAANKESSTQASPTSTAANSTKSGAKTNTKHGNEAKESGKFVKREQKSYKQTAELSHF